MPVKLVAAGQLAQRGACYIVRQADGAARIRVLAGTRPARRQRHRRDCGNRFLARACGGAMTVNTQASWNRKLM